MVPRRFQVPLCSLFHGLEAVRVQSYGRSQEPNNEHREQEGMFVPTLAQAWGEVEAGGFLLCGDNTQGTRETPYDSLAAHFVSAEELPRMPNTSPPWESIRVEQKCNMHGAFS